ncbi:hypothetical protein [Pseudomonas abietaniphila]|uniref:hypothetical protein n=1 Tax=Pseudomonas abietaniphila TaxID=89065 RepID=UPI000784414D|nr:hypothetical protein [Pseudomonas abietaniphila]
MAARGKKSVASMQVAHVGVDSRLAPPAGMTAAQKAAWVTVINARPADWFGPENSALLVQYCRHRVQADILAEQLEQFDPAWLADDEGLKRYDKLSGMVERETRTLNALLRSMRLTQQSLVRADKAVDSQKERKPWQVEN